VLTALYLLGAVHLTGWLTFFVVTLRTLSPDEVRKHALAAFLTALICGFLWPLLLFKEVSGKTPR
jgi:hypothetical protein